MRAEDLKLDEIIEFAEGEVSLRGRRLVLHSIDAFARFRGDLIETVGLAQARRILTRFGFFWGEADAAAMGRIFTWDNFDEYLKAGPLLHGLQGVARNQIKSLVADREKGSFECHVNWYGSGEAEEHLLELGKSDHPVCWMLAGYASGYFSYCMGSRIYFVEEKCRAKGDRICSAVGRDEGSWGGELERVRGYFSVEDIAAKIRTLTRELRQKTRQLEERERRLRALEGKEGNFAEIRSKAFQEVLELVDRVAPYDSTLLILGETGVGKEVLARRVHSLSRRQDRPFVAVNCGALPETLLESELFGHKAGSFTGASQDRVGLFESANGGTIFLDEIGDVSPATQVKLLRVLQSREITRVGESTARKIDVRVISATNRNLEQAMEAGQFREDLYYRLGVIRVEVPPLRKRADDILPLARFFVERVAAKLNLAELKLDPSCLDYLINYQWPGNVRELENAIERAAVMSEKGVLRARDLPPAVLGLSVGGRPGSRPLSQTLAEVERTHVLAVLAAAGGNRSRAAEILAISPTTLWRKLKGWEQ